MGYDPGSITCPIKVQLFWKGLKNMPSSSWFGRLLSKCPNHEEDCASFCGPLRKAKLYLKVVPATFFFNWYTIQLYYIILHAMILTLLMMQIIQCFPPFSMNDSTNKNSVFLTLQNPLLPRIHCKKVYFGSVFVFARRLDTFIFTTAKCIVRFLTSSRLDIINYFSYTVLKSLWDSVFF